MRAFTVTSTSHFRLSPTAQSGIGSPPRWHWTLPHCTEWTSSDTKPPSRLSDSCESWALLRCQGASDYWGMLLECSNAFDPCWMCRMWWKFQALRRLHRLLARPLLRATLGDRGFSHIDVSNLKAVVGSFQRASLASKWSIIGTLSAVSGKCVLPGVGIEALQGPITVDSGQLTGTLNGTTGVLSFTLQCEAPKFSFAWLSLAEGFEAWRSSIGGSECQVVSSVALIGFVFAFAELARCRRLGFSQRSA